MKCKLNHIYFMLCWLLLSGVVHARQLDKNVFELINLDYPGLSEVKTAYAQGDIKKAADELLAYYRNRTGVRYPGMDLKHITCSDKDKQRADEALAHILFAHEGYQPSFYYGKDINWRYWPIKDGELRLCLHRHEWFTSMGRAYHATRDEKYAKEWIFQYRDWIRKNPLLNLTAEECKNADEKLKDDLENMRYAWRPLEVGGRLLDQPRQFLLFNSSPNFTPEFLMEFLANYHRHATYLIHHYSAEGNHLLFEAEHAFYAGTFFPEFKDAIDWRKSGVEVLRREIKKQVFEDGGQYELDPLYHLASIGIFSNTLEMAELNGLMGEFPQDFMDTIEKMIVFYYNICYPDYTNPCFSDAKRRGKSSKIGSYRAWTKFFPKNEQIRYFATEGKEGRLPENLSKGFLTSGFFTFRNGWKDDATVMVVKAGPKGEWHNQPDNGTFELWFNGTNLFPDTGFYVYAGDDGIMKLRNWFRQTMVHKTLTLDNKNLETQSSVTRLWKPEGKVQTLVTENQSYKDLKHRRSVFFVDGKYFVIVDEAVGDATGKIGLHYQMNAGKVDINPKEFTLTSDYGGNSNAKLQCFAPEGAVLEEEEGWQATLYLVREKRTAVSFDVMKKDNTPVRYITVIYPTEDCDNAPEMSARFVNPQYDENSLKVEVTLDGVKKVLDYKL